jgi:DNA-binding NarL/FixJ family response regulator
MSPPRATAHTGGVQKVFLVEDSGPVRQRLHDLLAATGACIVGHAQCAQEAIEAILEKKPDVVVLDLSLAAGSGFDVLRAVHSRQPQIDFYMLSNFASEPYRRFAAQLGARGFFDKTSEFERVRDVVAARTAESAVSLQEVKS